MVDSANLETIFAAALDLSDADERAAFLVRACGDDVALRQRIESLLSAYNVGEFLESPAAALDATALLPPIGERPGDSIGPYKLLEQIGEGGMGLVFMAEQSQPLRRRVALKIIKPGLDTRAVIARFEAERQALALMDHPNIARVYDAGATDTGRPYFVMELVRGAPITEYCRDRGLDLRQRLDLFIEVCQAVQHAHQKGVIHRDLKPTNILVSQTDTAPVPKVIDFGVAKATASQSLTDKTLFTAFTEIIGTPLYMSPEQADPGNQDVDTRSDVYSLGVVLYELLTGATPFDAERLRGAGADEMRRIIREEEPPKPSTRATTAAEALSTVATGPLARGAVDVSALRGDLDWIVMKALEKDRRRRYASPGEFADDVRRFLNDDPVEAAAPGVVYRARKYVRRHRGRVALAAAALAACLVGLVGLGVTTVAIAQSLEKTKVAERHAAHDRDQFRNERDRAESALYVADVRLAHEEWKHAHVVETNRLLKAHLPRPGERDLRGWEWHYLAELVRSSSVMLGDNTSQFRNVAWSPDGRRLATADADFAVKIWDAVTLRELKTLGGHTDSITCVEWSPDSKRIATADLSGAVRIWDLESATSSTFEAFKAPARCVAWSPDGKRLAVGGDDEDVIKIWDSDANRELIQLPGHHEIVWSVSWNPDGQRLASIDNDHTIRVWDVESGELVSSKADAHGGVVPWSVSWSPDGKRLATGGNDCQVKVWNVDDWESRTLAGHVGDVISVRWSRDGSSLASSSTDGTIILWDVESGAPRHNLKGHQDSVSAVSWRRDGRRLASASSDGTVRLWDAEHQPEYLTMQKQAESFAAWSPDGKWLATSLKESDPGVKLIQILDAATGDPVGEPIKIASDDGPFGDGFTRTDWSLDGNTLAIAFSSQHKVGAKIVDVATRTESATLFHLVESENSFRSIAFNPDASLFAAAMHSEETAVIVWDTTTGNVVATLQTPEEGFPLSVAWSPDGRRLAAITFAGFVKIWNTANWRQLMKLDCHPQDSRSGVGGSHLVCWSPAGDKLAAGSVAGRVVMWEAATGREVLSFSAHSGHVMSVAFSPDGSRLATGGKDRSAKIWDAASGDLLLTLGKHDMHVADVAWNADGSRLLTTETGHFIWSAPGAARSSDE